MKASKSFIIVTAVVFAVLSSCTVGGKRSVAIVADSGVIQHNADALVLYAASIEADGIRAFIIEDVWGVPDSIREVLKELYVKESGGPDADKYVYAGTIWQVPDDTDYPLNPGESIIIAQMADDHQKSNLNPTSPVNLLSAEFETFINTTAIIQDNPAINMDMAFWPRPTPQWLTTVFGGAFVIFMPSIPIDPNSETEVVSPVGQTAQSYRIPIEDVIDALENVGNENQMQLKRMPAVLDAGAVTVGGTYVSKSVARRVKETLPDGRIILYDTNNSTYDFEVMDTPTIRRYGVKAPAWNTWK